MFLPHVQLQFRTLALPSVLEALAWIASCAGWQSGRHCEWQAAPQPRVRQIPVLADLSTEEFRSKQFPLKSNHFIPDSFHPLPSLLRLDAGTCSVEARN